MERPSGRMRLIAYAPHHRVDFEKQWQDDTSTALPEPPAYPEYKNPKKKWRLKQGAVPHWYKARNGVRSRALSGAARVAKYRPHKFN